MKTKFYIHTLNGRPATFDGNQVCYANQYGFPSKAVSTLKQIKKEQEQSRRSDEKRKFPVQVKYGYRRYT